MAKIHWIVYLLAGFLTSSVSWKLNYDKFLLFFYVGILFILIGIAKMTFSSGKKDEKPLQHKAQNSQATHRQPIHQNNQNLKRCPYCSNVARIHDNFCSRCGRRI
ncbi:MAG TPA: hypothetical protein VJI97_02630 [Candidatus Nanoarchaeia archaeon]|nr:hypothetical protein [Candidatus Nanoarchaeia archaeon]